MIAALRRRYPEAEAVGPPTRLGVGVNSPRAGVNFVRAHFRSVAYAMRAAVTLAATLALVAATAADAHATRLNGTVPGDLLPRSAEAPLGSGVQQLAPVVTLDSLPLRSGNRTPAFSGTASETTPVTIYVYAGETAEGEPARTLDAPVSGGTWLSASVTPPLPDGRYVAIATQEDVLGGGTGISNEIAFDVDGGTPTVTLVPPPSRFNDTTPAFSGTASEGTEVTIEIFEGTSAQGTILATASAQGTHGAWTSDGASPELPSGRHTFTAIALQRSEIKNAPGTSAPVTFVVDTEPPDVTLAQPQSPSNDVTPSFTGTASEASQVRIEIFEGAEPEGEVVATTTAAGTGAGWASGLATPPLHDGTFTVIATQSSTIGNSPGTSAPVTFVIDTQAPTVTLTSPLSPSANTEPSFSGTASDITAVTVEVYKGTTPEGEVAASATAEVDHGEWLSSAASPPLEWGVYTAVARQESSIGNPSGSSSPATFTVEPIPPLVVTEGASAITRTSAALYGFVDPRGAGVSACYFELGVGSAYDRRVECGFVSGIEAFPPAATGHVPVFVRVYGLTPGAGYHFRAVAQGQGGVGYGSDEAFTTLPPFSFDEGSAPRAGISRGAARTTARQAMAALIAKQLERYGRTAKIGKLLKRGTFSALFRAPASGRVVVGWRYRPPAARATGRTRRGSVVVASGALTFSGPGSAALKVRLTPAGRRVLAHARRISLTAKCNFTPVGADLVRASVPLRLAR
jgi:hypothetical protein